MLELKLALRTLARRKGRMALIGALVAFGSFLIVFGTTFASSAAEASRSSIIDHFTGDFILYSERSKDLPSPFAFNTPLPRIKDSRAVEERLAALPEVEAFTGFAQNYGVVQAEREGRKVDLPLIYYAVDPASYPEVFSASAGFLAVGRRGVLVSEYQNDQYSANYGLRLEPGEKVTLLGVTEGGVNALPSAVAGVFAPRHYTSVFNYINFMDRESYAELYSFAGVEALPEALDRGLAQEDEDAIFALAGDSALGGLDLGSLVAEPLSGTTMIAVRLADRSAAERVIAELESAGLGVKAARWDAASGFYAKISAALQAFIFLATGLVFLVVALIFMNTLIINVTERTAEIGTMRAIGTDKSFIRRIFLAEALVLNLAAALVGMAAAGAAMAAFARGGVPLPEIVSQFLIGGGSLPLRASAAPFALGLGIVAAVSILATLYPVSVATSITPLKAMSDK